MGNPRGIHNACAVASALFLIAATDGNWKHETITNPMDDSQRSVLSVEGDNGILALKCDKPGKGSVYAQVVFNEYLSLRRKDYTFRFRPDDGKASSTTWSIRGRSAIELEPADFVSIILGANKLAVQTYNSRLQEVTAVFDITGSHASITGLYEACEDRLPK